MEDKSTCTSIQKTTFENLKLRANAVVVVSYMSPLILAFKPRSKHIVSVPYLCMFGSLVHINFQALILSYNFGECDILDDMINVRPRASLS